MKRKLIKSNPIEEHKIQRQLQQKEKLRIDALELVSKHIEVKDEHLFLSNMKGYVMKELRLKTKDFSDTMTDAQVCELLNFPMHILNTINGKWNELKGVEQIDCNWYAETDLELEKLDAVLNLIDALSKIESYGITVNYNDLSRLMWQVLESNGNTAKPNPNPVFIKNLF